MLARHLVFRYSLTMRSFYQLTLINAIGLVLITGCTTAKATETAASPTSVTTTPIPLGSTSTTSGQKSVTGPATNVPALSHMETPTDCDSLLSSVASTSVVEQKAREIFDKRIGRDLGYEYPVSFEEVTKPELGRLFPRFTFYRVSGRYKLPPGYTIVAARNGQAYGLPEEFNRLLLDAGLKVTDENRFEVARAFVLVSKPQEITHAISFKGDTEMAEQESRYGITYEFGIEAWSEVNGIYDKWKFALESQQVRQVKREIIDVGVGEYLADVEGPLPTRGTIVYYRLESVD